MSYSYSLFDSSQDVDPRKWYAVCDLRDNPSMDLRFIRVVEKTMTTDGKYWCAIFYDDVKTPVACICFSLYTVDGALLAPPSVQSFVESIRKVIPVFLRFKVLIAGLPVTTGHPRGQIALAPGADLEKLAPLFDEVADQLARKHRAKLIAFKEFDQEVTDALAPLKKFGYRLAHSLLTYSLKSEFADFDEYYQKRSKRTRANMRKVFDKFEAAGYRCVNMKGGDGADKIYTDDVHQLYEAVLQKAQVKFERIPAEFFRELARQMPEESKYTFFYKGDKVVGVCSAVTSPVYHCMLYCGVDYELNPEADIYFNLIYRAFGYGLLQKSEYVKIGASADEFKSRMGCFSTQLFFYVRAVGKIRAFIFKPIAGLLLR